MICGKQWLESTPEALCQREPHTGGEHAGRFEIHHPDGQIGLVDISWKCEGEDKK